MRISEMNWMQVERRVAEDDRCVLPIGSVEQHAYLSLATDSILAERVSVEAAEPLGVPVFPVVSYGLSSNYAAFPGTVTLRLATYAGLVADILDSLHRAGFRRVLIVNGHGGNAPVLAAVSEWLDAHADASVKMYDWWRAPRTWAKVMETDAAASHASWMENFPWTRLAGVAMPLEAKPGLDYAALARVDAGRKRKIMGDGNYHGRFFRSDDEMLAIWKVAVDETRTQIEDGWH